MAENCKFLYFPSLPTSIFLLHCPASNFSSFFFPSLPALNFLLHCPASNFSSFFSLTALHQTLFFTAYGLFFFLIFLFSYVDKALDHTAAQEPISVASIYKFEGMKIHFVAKIEMDSIRTVADFLLELHDLWGSPLAAGLSLNCPWPGYHARYYHANSMTFEPVLVEEVDMFNEDDPFALWFLSNVNLVVFRKVD